MTPIAKNWILFNVHTLLPALIAEATLHGCPVSSALPSCEVSDRDHLGCPEACFVKRPSAAISHVSTGALGLGKKDDKAKVPFSSQTQDACHDDLEHRAKVVLM